MSFNLTSLQECLDSKSPFCKIDIEQDKDEMYQNQSQQQSGESKLEEIYASFIEHFGDLMMAKHKLMGSFCAYTTKIKSGLSYGSRIIVVVIPDDGMPMGAMRPLHTLHWLNFQTRFTTQEIPTREFNMPETKNTLVNSMIERVQKDGLKSVYKVHNYPELKVTLFKKKDSIQDWAERNKLYVALHTFCCSVDII